MASGWYNQGLADCLDNTIVPTTTTLKIMLVNANYVYNPDHDTVDTGTNDSGDPSFCEISATNYTGGYGGGGRKTATITRNVNDADNRIDYAIADLTWTALGGAANDNVGGAILIRETGGSDATARLVAFFDITDRTTTGNDFQLDFNTLAAGGNLRIAV